MDTSARRSDQGAMASIAVAFYGRTNQSDPHAPTTSARQYHQCLDAIAGCSVINHFYDDMLHTPSLSSQLPHTIRNRDRWIGKAMAVRSAPSTYHAKSALLRIRIRQTLCSP